MGRSSIRGSRCGSRTWVVKQSPAAHYEAIVFDLFEGPHARTPAKRDPLYGESAIDATWNALAPGGMFAIWAEAPDRAFEGRLRKRGFAVEGLRPGRGGYRHWVALARRPGNRAADRLQASDRAGTKRD